METIIIYYNNYRKHNYLYKSDSDLYSDRVDSEFPFPGRINASILKYNKIIFY